MNSKQSNVLIQKHTKSDYETRFLLQSKNHSPNSSSSPHHSPNKMNSRAVRLLGGAEALDFFSIFFAERIAEDEILTQVYKDLNTKTLVHIQKVLLLLALDDHLCELTRGTRKQVYSQKILQRHVRLGLMQKEEYFDRLANHLANALQATQLVQNTMNVTFFLCRFAALRPLLEISQELVEVESKRMSFIRLPFLGNLRAGKKKGTLSRCGQ